MHANAKAWCAVVVRQLITVAVIKVHCSAERVQRRPTETSSIQTRCTTFKNHTVTYQSNKYFVFFHNGL